MMPRHLSSNSIQVPRQPDSTTQPSNQSLAMKTLFSLKPVIAAVLVSSTLTYAASTLAEVPAPARVRGTIAKVSGDNLEVTLKNGKSETLKLATEVGVMGVTRAALGDIKADSFVGTAAVTKPDGTLEALEVTLFPAGMKAGEGHFPWDLGNQSSMTNGTVSGMVVTAGRTLTLKYKDGEKKISVPADVPIVRLEQADRTLLVPGAHAVFFMKPGAGGKQEVARAAVGKDGVVPPM